MIDTFFRIRSLSILGIKIHLHCFEYGRPHPAELESLCENVEYYPRKSGIISQLSFLPYIISGRKSDRLLENLFKYDFPVLFDGLHTTYYLNHPALSHRRKLVRLHNIEHRYYQKLAENENNLIRKIYYQIESFRLKRYERILRDAEKLLTISWSDQEYFENRFGNSELVLPSHPFDNVESIAGSGEYILFHGDLSVNQNAAVAGFLIDEVFSKIPYQCIIAGKNPSDDLKTKISSYNNISIVSNPDNEELATLISGAHINILPALSSEGFKLKLLFALFSGRHCIVNSAIVKGTNLDNLCHIADSAEALTGKIDSLMRQPFTEEMISEREIVLTEYYNNTKNTILLIGYIFPD
jgi:glycosyltransferase involved in cell wall biosynthesis